MYFFFSSLFSEHFSVVLECQRTTKGMTIVEPLMPSSEPTFEISTNFPVQHTSDNVFSGIESGHFEITICHSDLSQVLLVLSVIFLIQKLVHLGKAVQECDILSGKIVSKEYKGDVTSCLYHTLFSCHTHTASNMCNKDTSSIKAQIYYSCHVLHLAISDTSQALTLSFDLLCGIYIPIITCSKVTCSLCVLSYES